MVCATRLAPKVRVGSATQIMVRATRLAPKVRVGSATQIFNGARD